MLPNRRGRCPATSIMSSRPGARFAPCSVLLLHPPRRRPAGSGPGLLRRVLRGPALADERRTVVPPQREIQQLDKARGSVFAATRAERGDGSQLAVAGRAWTAFGGIAEQAVR